MRLPSGLEPLRERSFRLFFAANTVSSFGGSMAYIALAFAVLRIGGPTDLGLVILAHEVPALVVVSTDVVDNGRG